MSGKKLGAPTISFSIRVTKEEFAAFSAACAASHPPTTPTLLLRQFIRDWTVQQQENTNVTKTPQRL